MNILSLVKETYLHFLKGKEISEKLKSIDKSKRYRNPNFPEIVSEFIIFCFLTLSGRTCNRHPKNGDLEEITKDGKILKIEVKCFSSKGPSSFGPKEYWDIIFFVDATNLPNITIYESDKSFSSEEWKNVKINKNFTFADVCNSKKRPRISFRSLPRELFHSQNKFNIFDILNKYEEKEMETKHPEKEIRFIDLFCGIGGIRLGLQSAYSSLNSLNSSSLKCVLSNDIDEKCKITYETNFKESVDTRDIRNIPSSDIPDFDILLAGSPCQSWSIAGNKKGFEDERGQLIFEVFRILKEKSPKMFLFENVDNLKTINNGESFSLVKKEFKKAGYKIFNKILNTSTHSNIPQNRSRLFIVGIRQDIYENKGKRKFKFPCEIPLTRKISEFLHGNIEDVNDKYFYTEESKIFPTLKKNVIKEDTIYQYRRGIVRENKSDVCPTLVSTMGTGGHNVPLIIREKRIRKLTPRECLNFQGFPKDYKLPNIADSHFYKQIGNSVTIEVIRRICKKMKKYLN